MLAEGINPALIENAGKMTGMPMASFGTNGCCCVRLGTQS